MSGVRARFYVRQTTKEAGDTGQVTLTAVSRGEENKHWAAYTPSGTLTMALSRKAGPALEWFEARVGKEVFLDLTDADQP